MRTRLVNQPHCRVMVAFDFRLNQTSFYPPLWSEVLLRLMGHSLAVRCERTICHKLLNVNAVLCELRVMSFMASYDKIVRFNFYEVIRLAFICFNVTNAVHVAARIF